MKRIKFSLPVIAISFLLITQLQAQSRKGMTYLGQDLNAITTAVPFVTIAPDSRAGAMGDIGCATSADGNSQSYNPAKYVFNDNRFGFSVSYSPWIKHLVNDINLAYLTGYWRISDNDAIAASLRYFSLGNIDFMDEGGAFISSQNPNEFAIDFTYARKLIDQLSLAITPRFIYSNLTAGQYVGSQETRPGLAGAADISLFYEQDFHVRAFNNSTLRAGLAISNIGNKMSYSSGTLRRDFLPTNLKLGIGYEMDFDGYNKLAINGEINKLLVPTPPRYLWDSVNNMPAYNEAGDPIIEYGMNPDVSVPVGMIQSFYDAPGGFREEMREIIWALGAEYSYRDLFFVRLGYFHESQYKGNRQFISVGAGIKYTVFGIDVSYLIATKQQHPLANTLRFTLNLDFVSTNKNEIKQQGRFR